MKQNIQAYVKKAEEDQRLERRQKRQKEKEEQNLIDAKFSDQKKAQSSQSLNESNVSLDARSLIEKTKI